MPPAVQRIFRRRRWRRSLAMSLYLLSFFLPLLIWQGVNALGAEGRVPRLNGIEETGVQTAVNENDSGETWIEVSELDVCPPTLTATAWVANRSSSTWTDGAATIHLPYGMTLKAGQSESRTLGNVTPSDVAHVTWRLQAAAVVTTTYQFSVTSRFSGSPDLIAEKQLVVPQCVPTSVEVSGLTGTFTRSLPWYRWLLVTIIVVPALKLRSKIGRRGSETGEEWSGK